jgi:hypothetical protein
MVNGCAFVYVGTGTAGALELLGYTEAGVDKDIKENKREIMTDLFGDMTPQDFQDMGMVARIVCPMIAMDRSVFAKVYDKGDRATVGLLNTPGLVLGVAGYSFRVAIASPADAPWSFGRCVCLSESTRLATKANPYRFEFFAWPAASYTALTGKDAPFSTRSLS